MRRSLNDVRDARMKVPADEQQRVRFYFSLLFACRKRPSTHFELVYMFTFFFHFSSYCKINPYEGEY